MILLIGWFIAGFLKRLISKFIKRTKVDSKLGSGKIELSSFSGKLVYFFIMIFVFMLALEKLGITSVLDPVKNPINGFKGYIPNIVGTG